MNRPSLNLIVIRSTQVEVVAAFYRCLGIEFRDEQHGKGPRHLSADLGGTIFEIYLAKNADGIDRTTRLGFAVQDIDASIAVLRGLGATIISEPKTSEWGVRAVVQDPDLRSVELSIRESSH